MRLRKILLTRGRSSPATPLALVMPGADTSFPDAVEYRNELQGAKNGCMQGLPRPGDVEDDSQSVINA